MIGAPTTLTTSGQLSHYFSPSSSTNNYAATLQPVIISLRTRHKSICEYYGRIGHKADACIIRGPKFLTQIIRRNMNQFNALHVDEQKKPPIEWKSQTPADHFKYRTSPSKTNPKISAIMGRLTHHAIDNRDDIIPTSEFPVESISESFTYPYTTPMK